MDNSANVQPPQSTTKSAPWDDKRFGQKLLERMGWKTGEGLGVQKQGIAEPIRVRQRVEQMGLGYKDNPEAWTQHEASFSQLLKDLSKSVHNTTTTNNTKTTTSTSTTKRHSLVERSQNSRVRLHYHKFTKGKDLSRYSDKDLANILGRTSLNKQRKSKQEESATTTATAAHNSIYDVGTFNGGTINAYFKSKLISKTLPPPLPAPAGDDDDDSDEQIMNKCVGFGFNNNSKDDEHQQQQHEQAVVTISTLNEDDNDVKQDIIDEETNTSTITCNNINKKLNKKRQRDENEQNGLVNDAFNENSPQPIAEYDNNSLEVEISERKRNKKKKKKRKRSDGVTTPGSPENNATTTKKAKNKKRKVKINNPDAENRTNGIVNAAFDINATSKQITAGNYEYDDKISPPSKKKKQAARQIGIVNAGFDEQANSNTGGETSSSCSGSAANNNNSNNKKSSSGKKMRILDSVLELPSKKSSKKLKQQNNNDSGITNQAFNDLTTSNVVTTPMHLPLPIIDDQVMLNVCAEPSKQKRRKSVRFSDVNQERIIPNREQNELFELNGRVLETLNSAGIDNIAFNQRSLLEEDADLIAASIDQIQAEVENDMNENRAKWAMLTQDETRCATLKFTEKFEANVRLMRKHGLGGDLRLYFPSSNVAEIKGYPPDAATDKTKAKVSK